MKKKCIAWMHCKSLWIKASAKCINVNDVSVESQMFHSIREQIHNWDNCWYVVRQQNWYLTADYGLRKN